MSSGSALFPTVRGRVVCMFVSVHYCSRTGAACRRATSSRVVVASYTMRERSVVKSRLQSAAARLRHRRPERALAALRALGRIMRIDTGNLVSLPLTSCCKAFSKRKLCNGENFRIKYFDEFRCFCSSWVKIVGFKKIYLCMYVYMYVCKSVCICETKFCPRHNSWTNGQSGKYFCVCVWRRYVRVVVF